jgi:site-specific DNA-methyltransferase (adenine-specific)
VKKAEKLGRWPANIVLDLDAAQELDLQTGELSSGSGLKRRRPTRGSSLGYFAGQSDETDITTYGDSGGASRFFYCAKAAPGERDAGLPDGMKNKHPTVKPIALM